MKVLRARIYDKFQQEAQAEYDQNRKSAVGTETVPSVSARTIFRKTA